jgi:hypothetical protein
MKSVHIYSKISFSPISGGTKEYLRSCIILKDTVHPITNGPLVNTFESFLTNIFSSLDDEESPPIITVCFTESITPTIQVIFFFV